MMSNVSAFTFAFISIMVILFIVIFYTFTYQIILFSFLKLSSRSYYSLLVRSIKFNIALFIKSLLKQKMFNTRKDSIVKLMALVILSILYLFPITILPWGSEFFINKKIFKIQILHIKPEIIFLYISLLMCTIGTGAIGWFNKTNISTITSIRYIKLLLISEGSFLMIFLSIILYYNTDSIEKIVEIQNQPLFAFLPKWGIFTNSVSAILFLLLAVLKSSIFPVDIINEKGVNPSGNFSEFTSIYYYIMCFINSLRLSILIIIFIYFYMGGYLFFKLSEINGIYLISIEFLVLFIKFIFVVFIINFIKWPLIRCMTTQIERYYNVYVLSFCVINLLIVFINCYLKVSV